MKLALIGYGKMGKTIEKVALARGHSVAVRVDPALDGNQAAVRTLLQDVDLCIDFSDGKAVPEHVETALACKKPLVIGTTGWQEMIPTIKKQVEESKTIGVIYSPNFSLGVNLFLRLVKDAAKLFNPFEGYDVAGFEVHHHEKSDSPSGTGRAIAELLVKGLKRKKRVLLESVNRKVEKEELQFTSVRCGSVPGTHTVIFDSPNDSITLTHEARSREGFAEGALIAAEWLVGKAGFFSIDDLLDSFKRS